MEAENCVDPRNVTLDVALLTSENDTSHVNLTWELGVLDDTSCIVGHHKLSVRMFNSSDPFDFEDTLEPQGSQHTSLGYITIDSHRNDHVFKDVDKSLYYQFELRVRLTALIMRPDTSVEYIIYTHQHFSYIHYFDEQRAARVVDPVQPHTVIRATEGQKVVFPCMGSGIPSPLVTLIRDENSSNPINCSNCVIDLNVTSAVGKEDAGEYFCVAENTLVRLNLQHAESGALFHALLSDAAMRDVMQ